MSKINAAEMPTMPAKCATCPFGPKGDRELRERVIERTLFKASQLCHHPRIGGRHGRKETHLCRGARDLQCQVLYGIGLLPEPTDEAFRAESARILGRK